MKLFNDNKEDCKESRNIILTIGNLKCSKNIKTLIDAFENIQDMIDYDLIVWKKRSHILF